VQGNAAIIFLPSTVAQGRLHVATMDQSIFARGCARVATNDSSTSAEGCVQVAEANLNLPATGPSYAARCEQGHVAPTLIRNMCNTVYLCAGAALLFQGALLLYMYTLAPGALLSVLYVFINDLRLQRNICSTGCAHTVSVYVWCVPACTYLCIATSLLILIYLSSALLLVGVTLTNVCESMLAGAYCLCVRGCAAAAQHECTSALCRTLTFIESCTVAHMYAMLLQHIVSGMSMYFRVLYATAHPLCTGFYTMIDISFSCLAQNPVGRPQAVFLDSQPQAVLFRPQLARVI